MQEISKRKFGIEMEIGLPSEDLKIIVANQLPSGWNAVRDGSLRCDNPVEIVSPPLMGEKGINELKRVSEMLDKAGAVGEHPSCGMHTHLDAHEFISEDEIIVLKNSEYPGFIKANKREVVSTYYIDNRIVALFGPEKGSSGYIYAARWCQRNLFFLNPMVRMVRTQSVGSKILVAEGVSTPGVVNVFMLESSEYRKAQDYSNSRIESAIQLNLPAAEITELEKAADMQLVSMNPKRISRYVVSVRENVVDKLKTVLAFYVIFDPIMQNMVQDSRKKGNMYCQNISDSFTLEDVVKVTTVDEFEKLWFKTDSANTVRSSKGDRYNDSRYHNVNFHSLWRHGTIEIRSHSGTIDWRRIMLWTQLHQVIVDACAAGTISIEDMLPATKMSDLTDKTLFMIQLLNLPIRLDKYVRRMVSHFAILKKPL
jgi:hypothetical protein